MNRFKQFVTFENCIFVILLFIMVISPYYRGLFFAENYFVFHLICIALFIILAVFRWGARGAKVKGLNDSNSSLPCRLIDCLFWLLPFAYLISMIGAVEPGLARNEFLRNFNNVIVAMIIIMTVKTRIQQQIAVGTFFLTTVWVAVFGYGVMFGIWEFPDGMLGNRMSSVFQYPNTLAAFVGAGCLMGLFLILHYMVESTNQCEDLVSDSIKKWNTWLIPWFLVVVTLLFSVMLHTGSRGGWFVFIVVYVISLLVVPLRQKLFYIILSSVSMASGVYLYILTNRMAKGIKIYEIASQKSIDDPTMSIDPSLVVDYSSYITKFTLLAVALYGIAFVCNLLYQWISQDQKRHRQGQVALGTIVIIIIIAGIFLAPQLLTESANLDSLNTVWQRLQTLQNIESTSTDLLRFTFNRDAMKIVQDYPIFGAGGGAWQGLFQKYQDHPYWSTQAHTYYMQLATETGIFGLFSLLVLLCGVAIVFFIVICKADEAYKLQLWGVAIALLILLAHSAADFNMAYSSYSGYVWMLFALIVTCVSKKQGNRAGQVEQARNLNRDTGYLNKLVSPITERATFRWIQSAIIILITVTVFFVNIQPLNAINNYQKSLVLNQQKQVTKSFDVIRAAYQSDSKNVNILIYYTKFLNEIVVSETKEDVKQQYLQQLFAILKKASEQFPYNTRIQNQLIDMYFTHGYTVDAVNGLNRLVEIAPYVPNYYDRNIEYNYRLGLLHFERKEETEARQYWQQAINAYEQYIRLHKKIVEHQQPNEHQFRIQQVTRLYTALAYYSLDQPQNADEVLKILIPDTLEGKVFGAAIRETAIVDAITNEMIQSWLGKLK